MRGVEADRVLPAAVAGHWPPYPQFPESSCWARPIKTAGRTQVAPSYRVEPPAVRLQPAEIVARALRRLGDTRYVLRVELGPPPPKTLLHLKGYFAGRRPPRNARWAYIAAPTATFTYLQRVTGIEQRLPYMQAGWETDMLGGALRDDFCDAGGPPLVGWSVNDGQWGLSDSYQAFGQRFPNPSPTGYRRSVEALGRRYGFRVVSLRLLRPRGIAPMLVIETARNRRSFARDLDTILRRVDARNHGAAAFEGLYFEVRDAKGPFVVLAGVRRGTTGGASYSWNQCIYQTAISLGPGHRCP